MFSVEVGVGFLSSERVFRFRLVNLEAVAELGRSLMVAAAPSPSLTCKNADE